ncbi:acetyl-CoA C-acetyltransferase [Ferrimicrobium acidiphilum]|uniref:acetyl-CoA C-acetyltransferase n=1 Tax=Ferrimicrobium acidiphilum TaxID=121039 RepID=UPI0023F28AD2|nr:acetyl-CoA C-acetyltransferase [Ferrimicrobium acidiphilum]MCL5053908.1 acetyl-CoA C-acetyltransferase [Gammaproteobacteria bacterium]
MANSVIVSGARTPIGKLSGAVGSLTAMDLGAVAIKGALARAGLSPEAVEYVFMGHVLQAGQGQITARQAAAGAGIPMTIPATTVNKVCLSGLNSLHLADLMIRAGEADIVVAGGMESMTQAPYFLPGARNGFRMGDVQLIDSMLYDGLFCAFDKMAMGLATERYLQLAPISRERQDHLSMLSHERAARAMKNGRMAKEIVPVPVPQRRGDDVIVDIDEGVRPETTMESLAKLRPAFDKNGAITAGNASQISDGAAALVVMSAAKAAELGLAPLAEIIGYGQVAGPDTSLLHQPSNAINDALRRVGMTVGDIDLFEINEAFAAVAVASMDHLGIDEDVVNVNGGAIALGHPIGASGARLALTLITELNERGGGVGAAALCGGGGQGDALLVRVP